MIPHRPAPTAFGDIDAVLAVAGVHARARTALPIRQGAVATVTRLRCSDDREIVLKEYAESLAPRAAAEAAALRAVTDLTGVPAPALLGATLDGPRPCIVMSWMSGDRLDGMPAIQRWAALPAIGELLRRLHTVAPPDEVPDAPWLTEIEAYAAHDGPGHQMIAELVADLHPTGRVLCHGDPSAGNLLGVADDAGVRLTALLDWEQCSAGDPIWELARATFHASLDLPDARDALCAGYALPAADRPRLEALEWVHAAALWNWWTTTGEHHLRDRLRATLAERIDTR